MPTYAPSPLKAAVALIELGKAIRTHNLVAYEPIEFTLTNETTKAEVEAILNKKAIPKSSIIYTVSVDTLPEAYRLQRAFDSAKERLKPLPFTEGATKKERRAQSAQQFNEGRRSLSRRNFEELRKTKTLYVGSSRTDFYSRLNQHLGTSTGGLGTFALYLKQWALNEDLPLRTIVEFWYYDPQQLQEHKELQHPLVLQTLEDHLWRDVRPPFGREGAR